MQNNLTSLSNLKSWANVTSSADDALLTRLIGSVSQSILSYLSRPTLFQNTYNDVYDGSGRSRQFLRNWPVVSVGSLSVGSRSISQSSAYGQTGYYLEPWDGMPPGRPQAIDLFGHQFWPGHSNVFVTYTAGYVVQGEAWTVPTSPYQVTVTAPFGNWAVDQGVTYATGAALTPVTGTPTTGQYSVSGGQYTFSSADASASVLISYSYVPADIEQACLETVAERYNVKNRIGVKSKTLGGQETVSFSTSALNDYTKLLLQPFKKVIQL